MTKRFVLMRHAKSSWDDPLLEDRDRPLNPRGRKAAKALGKWLRSQDILPDLALVSDARRTQTTFKRLKLDCDMRIDPRLYLSGPEAMLETLQSGEGDTILMIGHNDGIAAFAGRLVSAPPPHGRFADFPTGATLVLDLPIEDWHAAHFGTGRVVNFITPRELTGDKQD
ncbi:SixA phosphatase family protein [Pseudooceanicola sp. C21-150M6]|uniref:SixA phosphatase family protein n=1 Tax=Pseudooceanicola sp. C21-150M6 TaxID=3434355 RepID=UPI003D7F8040